MTVDVYSSCSRSCLVLLNVPLPAHLNLGLAMIYGDY